jgi:T5SS/PEP-CTERM-associated repeat protein
LTVEGGTTAVNVESGDESSFTIGRDSGAVGTVTVANGATVTVSSNDSIVLIGQEQGATGTLTVSNGAKSISTSTVDGDFFIGAAFTDFGRSRWRYWYYHRDRRRFNAGSV